MGVAQQDTTEDDQKQHGMFWGLACWVHDAVLSLTSRAATETANMVPSVGKPQAGLCYNPVLLIKYDPI